MQAVKTVALYLGVRKETGGLFQYARTVAHALANARPDNRRLVALSPPGTEWEPICAQFGIEWAEVAAPSVAERALGKAIRTLAGHRPPRQVMSRITPLGRELAARGAGVCLYMESEHYSYELATPSLIPIHDLMHRYESRFEENRAYADADGVYSRICHGAAGVLVDSEVGRQQLIDSYGPFAARVHILPFIPPDYVYDERLLAPDPHLDEVLASVPERFFFYPAQFWEHKNHIRLIDAVMGIAERHPDAHLVLAGSPKNHYDAVMRHIETTGATSRVTVLGYVSDAAKVALYRRARAMVLPTFYGPTSIPPLEAFELGCAVAISRVYGNMDQLGDAALYFDPSSTAEMRDVLERLWADDDLHAELVRRGRQRARAWGPAQFAERLWRIVEETLAGSGTAR
jgi:glycosyltransferase involved in cell wall biosynthesis